MPEPNPRRSTRRSFLRANVTYVLVTGAWLFAAISYALMISTRKPGESGLPGWFIALTSFVVIAALITTGVWMIQRRRIAAVLQCEPDALVVAAARPTSLRKSLALYGYEGKKVSSYFVFAVRHDVVQFWSGVLNPAPRLTVPISDITGIEISEAYIGAQRLTAICTLVTWPSEREAERPAGFQLWFQMVPTRTGLLSGLLRYKAEVIEEIAESIRLRIQANSGNQLAPVSE